jgi:hypothetical protein
MKYCGGSPRALLLLIIALSAAATAAVTVSLRSASSSSNSSIASLSCLVGNYHAQSPVCVSTANNASYPWDECWSCINTHFRTVKVGGCFSTRWMNPLCTDTKASCLNDGRTGTTYVSCSRADCNSCSAAPARAALPQLLVLTVALMLTLRT